MVTSANGERNNVARYPAAHRLGFHRLVTPYRPNRNSLYPLFDIHQYIGCKFQGNAACIIPGGLVPMLMDVASGQGVYIEPNVWTVHQLDAI